MKKMTGLDINESSSKKPKVAVLILTHNGKHHLRECLESLRMQTYKDFEVYLIDNGSTDDTTEYVKKNFPWVNIIKFERNYGFTGAYNRAIKLINSEYVALLNDDTKVNPRWLDELIKVIEKDEKLFAVGSKILFYERPEILNHAGAKITPIGAGFDIGFELKDGPQFHKPRYVAAACGAAMLVRRKIFIELGGFDEDYFAYAEDLDICWRAWLRGYKVLYVPTSIVHHKFGGSWGKRNSACRIFFSTRNKFFNLLKNFEARNVIKGMIIAIIFDIIRLLLLLTRRNYQAALALIQAYISFVKKYKNILIKRSIVQHSRLLSDKELYKLGLIAPLRESILTFIHLEFRKKVRKIAGNEQ